MLEILPSVLACDFSLLKDEMKKAQKANVNAFHFDVMDYHFVPNLSFGAKFIEDFKKHTTLPCDVHLMIDNPEDQIDDFLKLGCRNYIFHIEVKASYQEIFKKVKGLGYQLGFSINPKTDIRLLEPYLDIVDTILIMLVEPGFCGQKIILETLNKIHFLNEKSLINSYQFKIYVDGGINIQVLPSLKNLNIDGIIMGSAFFEQKDYIDFVNKIRKIWSM